MTTPDAQRLAFQSRIKNGWGKEVALELLDKLKARDCTIDDLNEELWTLMHQRDEARKQLDAVVAENAELRDKYEQLKEAVRDN